MILAFIYKLARQGACHTIQFMSPCSVPWVRPPSLKRLYSRFLKNLSLVGPSLTPSYSFPSSNKFAIMYLFLSVCSMLITLSILWILPEKKRVCLTLYSTPSSTQYNAWHMKGTRKYLLNARMSEWMKAQSWTHGLLTILGSGDMPYHGIWEKDVKVTQMRE